MLAVYFEHPEWCKPLFRRLEERQVPFVKLPAHEQRFDPALREPQYALVFNRMSPSAHMRGHGGAIFYTHQYLAYLEETGTPVINGLHTWVLETSKARQLDLLHRLELRYPRARVINHPSQAIPAATGLRFPIVLKPNIGGSGAGIVRFDALEELAELEAAGELDLGLDSTALVQELLPARGGRIVRVETLGGRFLYAISLRLTDTFNLCPADYCLPNGSEFGGQGRGPADGLAGRLAEPYQPPPEVIGEVEAIMAQAGIDVGGVEYLINDRDGQRYYYDINALSNFVADAPNVIGFDPYADLADFVVERLAQAVPV